MRMPRIIWRGAFLLLAGTTLLIARGCARFPRRSVVA